MGAAGQKERTKPDAEKRNEKEKEKKNRRRAAADDEETASEQREQTGNARDTVSVHLSEHPTRHDASPLPSLLPVCVYLSLSLSFPAASAPAHSLSLSHPRKRDTEITKSNKISFLNMIISVILKL